MKRALTLLIIPVLLLSSACGGQDVASEKLSAGIAVSENASIQSSTKENSSVQNETFFSVYHSVLNPDNDAFLNSNSLDEQFMIDLSMASNSSEEREVLQEYIDHWSAELNSAEATLKSILNTEGIAAFEEAQTTWENDLDKDLSFFTESYLSINGSGSDIGIYTGYLMLEKVRTRSLELIDRILFFGSEYAFSQTLNRYQR